jgi:hypothetical protein
MVLTYNNNLNIYIIQSDKSMYVLNQTIKSTNIGDKFVKIIMSDSNTKIIASCINSNN